MGNEKGRRVCEDCYREILIGEWCGSCGGHISPELDDDAKIILKFTHEGFKITCNRCGSTDVGVDSTIGYSEESGMWGGVYLRCAGCQYETVIFD